MPVNLVSLDLGNRRRLGLLQVAVSTFLTALLSITPAFSQGVRIADSSETFDDASTLYECGSYYTVIDFCHKRGEGQITEEMNASAFRKRDKIIHLIFLNDRKSGILTETSLKNYAIVRG